MNCIRCQSKTFSMAAIAFTMLVLLFAGAGSPARAQTQLKTIENPEGGTIVYGQVDGANSQAAAMGAVLRSVHNNCGAKPQVGKLFRVRNTNSVAVFFTVVNRTQGNKPVAGLLIATEVASNHIEAALVTDDAARFGSTVNPMLTKLFSVWHAAGAGAASGPAAGEHSAGRSAPPATLRMVRAPDNSAMVGIPDGWTLKGNGGTVMVVDPNYNVIINLNLCRWATNPYGGYRNAPGSYEKIIYPSNVEPVRGFPGLLREFWRANGNRIDFRIARSEQVPAPPGQRCVHAIGRGLIGVQNAAEKDLFEMETLLCTTAPNAMGDYMVSLSLSSIAPNFADKWRATVGAIFASFQVNEAVVAQEAHAIAAPAIAAIHQIGRDAAARYAATDAANDAQHAGYWAQQDSNARRGHAFSNYLLDQTVIQDNNMYGNGTVGHGTAWNSTADALVRSNPGRYEIVQTPNFWKGVDY